MYASLGSLSAFEIIQKRATKWVCGGSGESSKARLDHLCDHFLSLPLYIEKLDILLLSKIVRDQFDAERINPVTSSRHEKITRAGGTE